MDDRKIIPSVELVAFVQERDGVTPVTILVEGGTPLWALTAMTLRAIASQHPHLSGKPITALRYNVRAQTRAQP